MVDYIVLSKLFYQNKDAYEQVYQQRFHSEYTVHLDFEVNENPAFFVQTPEAYQMLTNILRMNTVVSNLCQALPGAAIHQFSRRCLIDEIVLTNSIEGVRSTRKEISDILDELGRKSKGKVITRKPIVPTEEEIEENKRSKSSKLRVFERC